MGDILLDFRPRITPSNIKNLKKVANSLDIGQQLSVTIERTEAHRAGKIMQILQNNNYDYCTKGGHKNEFYIIGTRNKVK